MAYRVLIVDDSAAMRSFIRRVMNISGFECERQLEAADGREALDVLGREWVDLILTDINMPGMNGEEFVRRVEQDEGLRSIPILVVSTDSTSQRVQQMLTLGAKGYISKPFSPEGLRLELERLLELSHV